MSSSTPDDLTEIERLARAATPGPWTRNTFRDDASDCYTISSKTHGFVADVDRSRDAEFIAFCTPDRILSLVSQVRAGAEERARDLLTHAAVERGKANAAARAALLPGEPANG